MNIETLLLGLFLYSFIEAALRIGVLAYYVGPRLVSWKIITPHISMIVSPGYWLARNCKLVHSPNVKSVALRARLIVNYNLWNLVLSACVLVFVTIIKQEGYLLFETTRALVIWRGVSRSFEIVIAFGSDITTSKSSSLLTNGARMKLALRSYLEIFIYSAALYFVTSSCIHDLSSAILASLYVGTLTNVQFVADGLLFPHLAFLQVFSTLSLVLLSIAGYLGKVKKN